MIFHLYVKEHNITGLKYLGQTTQNPDKYQGSGVYWRNHLKAHGNDHSTYVIATFETKKELREAGINYSDVWNIIKSNQWANLKEESSDGNYKVSEDIKKKISLTLKGRPSIFKGKQLSETQKTNIGKANKIAMTNFYKNGGKIWNKGLTKENDARLSSPWLNKKFSEAHKQKISSALKGQKKCQKS